MIDSSLCLNTARIVRWLLRRLPWLTITPLGAEVEPDVYCRKASVDPSMRGSRQCLAYWELTLSVVIQPSFFSSGACSKSWSAFARIDVVVKAATGRASLTISCNRENDRFMRGGYAGTATAPA